MSLYLALFAATMHVDVCAVIVHESGGDVGGRRAWGL